MHEESRKLALVTGGIRGIGAAISCKLKESGYMVVANYRNNDDIARNFARETGIAVYKWDASDFDQCKEYVSKIQQDFGASVSILVNNAGMTSDSMFHKCDINAWMEVLCKNLYPCIYLSKIIYPKMRKDGFGRIINLSSVNALKGQVGQTSYSASKSAIIGFTKSLASESACKGVTANVIAPGYIATDMVKNVPKNILDGIISQTPAKRLGEPTDITNAVIFLVKSEFVNGATISVNGGYYMF